jgi:hypothetical protein
MTSLPVPLTDYMTANTWREQFAQQIFPTSASLSWFMRIHRVELVQRGALLLRGGRATMLVNRPLMEVCVAEITLAESRRRAGM